ncbi:flagellar hook-associated protein FlgL [Ramlibacter sp. H39-3-26]|uniref:flagellar hook-associated protein FlgL n=1 Tax=Curvibacter soli TaxID=3031331 RepID=UPI0023DB0CA0|nr:flagellar hook-associated protein FlgL [Ramlibacter sp. H39-3-26]MDF1485810.1 flagellar hook-associated protein FlgL [Ramlibacter sp. H39-3-26]
MANTRVGTYNAFDSAVRNINSRYATLSSLQENLTSGKRVLRPSDDPTAAAQAERARTRIARVETDQRALALQKDSITTAESTLGEANDALQSFRELVVSAGNGSYSATERAAILQQLTSLRDEIYAQANRSDSNGIPLFSGLGSAAPPFTTIAAGVQYQGIGGQSTGSAVSIPSTIDGDATWMSVPTGNGVFTVDYAATNTGTAWTDVGQVTNPSAVTGDNYTLQFSVVAGVTTYTVVDNTTASAVAGGPYTAGQAIAFDGISITPKGDPANGDSFTIAPSQASDVFSVLDKAIAGIRNAAITTGTVSTTNVGTLTHGITQALTQIDSALQSIQTARGIAGDLLNRADRINNSQTALSVQHEADRSRVEDMDMVQGISDFQNQQTGYSAALQSYAAIQKLSLFNFIS